MPIALAVHGGAWNMPDEALEECREGVRRALESAWRKLQEGAPSIEAVEHAVRILEDDPAFDAGIGSHLNRAGRVEMDASIMRGFDLQAGAVAAIQEVRHPVSVARQVMDRSGHVMLVGDGARNFAVDVGCELCTTEELLIGRERERYVRVRAGERGLVDNEFGAGDDPEGPMGTVGAVALDSQGDLAAATSTGGTQDKAPGRVGDTPVIGAGTYADNTSGAASATGWGEGILRVVLTKTATDLLAEGRDPESAAAESLKQLDRVRAKGGLILIDPSGRIAVAFNTPRMARGWVTAEGELRVAVERAEVG